jgi:hypothetical protein
MKSYDEMDYHPTAEKLVKILCEKVQNKNPAFFRVLVAYYFSVVASSMRCLIATHDRGELPVNCFALNIGGSGSGKGHSTNIVKNAVINQFRKRFKDETFNLLAEENLPKLAIKRANVKGTDPDVELEKVQKEFDGIGPLMFSFNEATVPAIKTLRHKLLMCDAGSLNLQIDEIGLNLIAAKDALAVYLELYDVGAVEDKLKLSTADNTRKEEILGNTPSNMMLFGAPDVLFDGGKVEDELFALIKTGFGRRCFFAISDHVHGDDQESPEQIYDRLTSKSNSTDLQALSDYLGNLADIINVNKRLVISKQTSLLLIEYEQKCKREASKLSEYEAMKKAEISHRYYKALKLAGAYAFIDDSTELTEDHLYYAIKLAEDSGAAFSRIVAQDKPWVKLAKYIASAKKEVTHADLTEDLPFYKGSASAKTDMLNLAIAYGYKNNIIIKKLFADGIEWLRGESLKETDLSQMTVAYSEDMTEGYENVVAPFDKLHQMTQKDGVHWVVHHLEGGYRNEENAIPGFNLVVIDVDGGTKIAAAKLLLKNYKYLLYTTKRHTEEEHRFRIVLPINYRLEMDAKDYKEFMSNIYSWLPFVVDTATNQRARKWLSHDGHFEYNDGELLDALPFIPKTSKNEERKQVLSTQGSMDNLERWVMNNIGDGNRNNLLLRYAMVLLDSGLGYDSIYSRVVALNDKIADKLSELEIMGTIMRTIGNNINKRP